MIIINKQGKFELTLMPRNLSEMKCILCGKRASENHHCIFGNANRLKSDKHLLTVALCHDCHWQVHNSSKEKRHHLEQIAQLVFEQTHSRDEWMSIFKKNYLWDKEK